MTGAPLPPGAEAVVPVEWTDGGSGLGAATGMRPAGAAPEGASGEVRVHRAAEARAHVRRPGQRRPGGRPRAGGGHRARAAADRACSPRSAAARSPSGRARAWWCSPPAANWSQPGEALGAGQIYDSNSFALCAAARDAGAIAYRVGAVTDDAAVLRDTIEDQLIRADLLVTTGGVSVGAYDVVKEALSSVGDEDQPGSGIDFRKLKMQPGKPQGFGSIGPDHTPLLALPGNPVSCYVSFELFVRPAIRTLMGLERRPPAHRPRHFENRQGAHLARRSGASSCAAPTTPTRAPSAPWAAPDRT